MPSLESILEQKLFPRVAKPGRYIGGELNLRIPRSDDLQIALAFPDLYEIGFAYFGFQILYHILGGISGISCQRVYAPAKDAEEILRRENIPLFTLEGKNPLREFDLIGFTLQYELHATNILNMLDLSGIPLRVEDRGDDDPIIVGGGPLSFNPEPFAPFFDAFIVGDGEETFPALIARVREGKMKGLSRTEIINRLSNLTGVYIPTLYLPHFDPMGRFSHLKRLSPSTPETIESVHVEELRPEYYPGKSLVPLIAVEHDRLSMEIMRGCTRGCRFCNAGMINRPTREVSPEMILRLLNDSLANTGYDELSLLSLSTADYSRLEFLLTEITGSILNQGMTLSFPSLRLDAFTESMAERITGGRKTGLTFAPEAGSERLRSVINKDLRNEDLFRALETAAKCGWKSVKLYFMVGLPTETEDDVESIVRLALKCRAIMKSSSGKPLHISIAPFSPKPHTPFQRAELLAPDEAMRRINIIRSRLRQKGFKVSFHAPEMAAVETLIARGDRRIAGVIERVFRSGARFEGWSDSFDYSRWTQAMSDEGLDWENFLDAIPPDAPLPWKHISTGISDEFLTREWERSRKMVTTPDCRWKCSDCGLGCAPPPKPEHYHRKSSNETGTPLKAGEPAVRLRFKFSLSGPSRYISHLETVKLVERALRRADFPVAYSRGFHPHPRISFGPALPLGYETRGDYFDVLLNESVEDALDKLNASIYGGIEIITTEEIPLSAQSLSALINLLTYEIRLKRKTEDLERFVEAWRNGEPVSISDRKGREWEVSKHIRRIDFLKETIRFEAEIIGGKSPRPDVLLAQTGYSPGEFEICRLACHEYRNGVYFDPIDAH